VSFSIYLLATISAWFVAQIIKYVYASIKSGYWFSTLPFFRSGNMPSVHTATTVGLATVIGLVDGPNSAVFAIALLLMAIVAYDAMGVRRASGEQGLALHKLLKTGTLPPYQSLGHKPIEVAIGAGIGLITSLTVVFITANV